MPRTSAIILLNLALNCYTQKTLKLDRLTNHPSDKLFIYCRAGIGCKNLFNILAYFSLAIGISAVFLNSITYRK